MKKSLILLPFAALMLVGCGEQPTPPPTHEHTLGSWLNDKDNHWKKCSECQQEVDKAAHADGNSDGKCDVCGYQMSTPTPPVHEHSWSTTYSSNETNHWKTCSGCDQKSDMGAHVDANKDYVCDVCGYNLPKPPAPEGDIVLDFSTSTIKDSKVFPYVTDVATLNVVTIDGYVYNSKGTYADCYKADETYYLSMKNKLAGDNKVVAGEDYAFIANADTYDKPIKSIEVEVSKQTGGVDFYVAFGNAAFTEFKAGALSGGESKTVASSTPSTFTITNPGTSEFFGIAATKAVGQYRKNGGVAKITIHF